MTPRQNAQDLETNGPNSTLRFLSDCRPSQSCGHRGTQKKGHWGCFLDKMLAHVPPSQGNTSGEPNPGYPPHARHSGRKRKPFLQCD